MLEQETLVLSDYFRYKLERIFPDGEVVKILTEGCEVVRNRMDCTIRNDRKTLLLITSIARLLNPARDRN